MSLEKLIQDRIDRLESVPKDLQTVIDAQDERLFKQILKDLSSLDVKAGRIESTAKNLSRINAILDNIRKTLFNSDYVEAIKQFAIEIGTQADLNNQIIRLTSGSFQDDEMFKATVAKSQHNALLLMDENAVAHNVIQPLAEILTTAITSNMSFSDAAEILRNNMIGENAILSKYAGTIIKDAFSISDRQYVDLVTRKLGIEFYRYDGSRVKTSRYFCCVRKGKIFHRDEIASWGDHPGLWDKPKNAGSCDNSHGGGRNPDTNSYTIFSYLGGFQCIDVLIPINTDRVPEADKQRARELGYFKD